VILAKKASSPQLHRLVCLQRPSLDISSTPETASEKRDAICKNILTTVDRSLYGDGDVVGIASIPIPAGQALRTAISK
jgi:hypothetical protein